MLKNSSKINPICPECFLVNIIFNFDRLPKKCQFCGADLIGTTFLIGDDLIDIENEKIT